MGQLEKFSAALEFLTLLTNGQTDRVTFQTFADVKGNKGPLTKILQGPLDKHLETLAQLNERGAGIFTTINETDGKGRKAENITSARALVVDFDKCRPGRLADLQALEFISDILEPSLVIESSPGKHHAYWLTDSMAPDQFPALQKALAEKVASLREFSDDGDDGIDKAVHDLPRVMRLPGFKHQKDPAAPFISRIVHNSGKRYSADDLAAMLPGATVPDQLPTAGTLDAAEEFAAMVNNLPAGVEPERLEHYLSLINDSSYETWLAVGMALHHETGGAADGLALWDQWSRQFNNYAGAEDLAKRWAGFNSNRADARTAASIIKLAQSNKDFKLYADDWAAPESLRPALSTPTPYPIDAWRPLLRDAIEATAHYAQVPKAMAGHSVLGALSHICQGLIDAPTPNSREGSPVSLYLVVEGETGSGKSSAMGISHAAIVKNKDELTREYKAKLKLWELNREGLSKKETAEYDKANPKPKNPADTFADMTIEALLDEFVKDNLKNASWVSDEGGQIFSGHTMKNDKVASALSSLTTLWSDGRVSRFRSQKTDYATPQTEAVDVRLSLFTMGQRIVLEDSLNDPMLVGQGFLARALIVAPPDLRGRRVWNDPERMAEKQEDDPRLIAYWHRCREIMAADTFEAETNGRQVMQFEDTETRYYFGNIQQSIEDKMADGGEYQHFKPFACRIAENTIRVAAIMAYFEKREKIQREDLERALLIVDHAMRERMRYSDAGGQDMRPVEKLSQWLIDNAKGAESVAKSRIVTSGPSGLRGNKRGALDEALDLLQEAGHIKIVKEGSRQKTMVHINPALLDR